MGHSQLRNFFRRMLRKGIKPEHSIATKLRIQMLNLDIYLGILISGIALLASFLPVFSTASFFVNALIAFVSITGMAWMVQKGHSDKIGFLSLFMGYVFVTVMYLNTGAAAEVHYFYIALCLTPMLYFFGNLRLSLFLSLLCFASYLIGEFVDFPGLQSSPEEIVSNLARFHVLLGTLVLAYKVLTLIYLYHQAWDRVISQRTRYQSLFEFNTIPLQEIDLSEFTSFLQPYIEENKLDEMAAQIQDVPAFLPEILKKVRITRVNQALLELTGAPDEKYYRDNFFQLLPHEALRPFMEWFKAYLAGESYFTDTIPLKTFREEAINVRYSVSFRTSPFPNRLVFSYQDVSDQLQMEQSLRDQAAFFETLLDTVPVPVFYKDKQGVYQGANTAFFQNLNIRAEDFIGKTVLDLAHPKQGPGFAKIDEDLLNGGGFNTYDSPLKLQDMEERMVRFYKQVYKDGRGNIAGLVGSMIDITDESRQTIYLNNANSRLRAILESTADAILVVDQKRVVTHYNQKFVDLFQIPAELLRRQNSKELVQHVSSQLVDSDLFVEKVEEYYNQADQILSDTLYFNDGRIVDRYSKPLIQGPSVIGRVWSFRDITEQTRIQQTLTSHERQTRDIINHANQGIFVVDIERMRPVSCNPRTLEIFGVPDEETFFNLDPSHFNGPIQPGGISRDQYLTEKIAQLRDPAMERITYDAIGRRLDGSTFPKRVEVVKSQYRDKPSLLFFVTDNSDRYAAEEQMRLHNLVIKTWVTHFPTIYYRFDREGNITDALGSAFAKLGIKPEEYAGRNIFTVYQGFPQIIEGHKRAMTGEFVNYSVEVPGVDGPVFFETSIFFDQATDHGIGLAFDVSARQLTERALRESEERFRKLFEHSPFGIAIRDMEANKIVDVNPRIMEMMGFSFEEMTQSEREVFTAWEDTQHLDQGVTELISGKVATFVAEKIYHRKDGSAFWARIHRGLVEINQKTYLIGFIEDIEARRQAESALRESEARYRLLFEHAFDGIMVFDVKTRRALDCNQQMLRYFGVPDKETMLTTSLKEFSPLTQPDGRPSREKLDAYIEQGLQNGSVEYEWLHQRRNGTQMHTYVYAIRYQTGDNDLYLVLLQDITAKKDQEKIIQDQMERLSLKTAELERYIDSNMQLENFAYIASHDLRAPLRAITNFTHLLNKRASGKLDDTEKEYLHFMSQAAENMYALIESLLTYSRVDSTQAEFKMVKMGKLMELVQNDLITEITESGAIIDMRGLPDQIYADAAQLRQLFQNLFANAIKFRQSDQVPEIVVSCQRDKAGFTFSVADNGIGIEPTFYERIFLLFKKLHSQDEYAGTGIGLALCKRVVSHHGGNIWVESTPGAGTTFFFTLPQPVPSNAPQISMER